MQRMTITLLALAALIVAAPAQTKTWNGYLADKMCGSKWSGEKGEAKAQKHTKDCALEEACAASGYGLFTGGSYVKFTDASDAMAKAYLEKSAPESNIYVTVKGTMDGEKIAVTSIEKAAAKRAKKGTVEKKPAGMHGGSADAACDCCQDGKMGAKHGAKGHTCGDDCMKKS